MASLAEWQNQMASLPKINGRTAIHTGGQIRLLDNDTVSDFPVRSVACQNAIIKILNPAKKNPQKYGKLLLVVKLISSMSPGLKMEKNPREKKKIRM